jgi:hypothetical protein
LSSSFQHQPASHPQLVCSNVFWHQLLALASWLFSFEQQLRHRPSLLVSRFIPFSSIILFIRAAASASALSLCVMVDLAREAASASTWLEQQLRHQRFRFGVSG